MRDGLPATIGTRNEARCAVPGAAGRKRLPHKTRTLGPSAHFTQHRGMSRSSWRKCQIIRFAVRLEAGLGKKVFL